MRSTFKVLFYLKRDKQKSNGMIPLYCRITVDGKEARFGMKCDVNPKYWDVEASKATGRTADALKINSIVENTIASIYNTYRDLQGRDNYVTAEKIKNVFLGLDAKQVSLLELFDSHNREKEKLIGISVCKSTCYGYSHTRKLLSDFIMYKFNLHDIAIREVNRQFIDDFEIYLYTQYSYSNNGAFPVLNRIKHIMEIAVEGGIIARNPFKERKLRLQKVDRGYLTQSEIETILDCQFEDKNLEKVRDIFIFCVFTGMAYIDVKHLTNSQIQSSIEGNMWIRGKRIKTNIEYNIPLLNIPKMILEKYSGKVKNGLSLPVFGNIYYNRLLKTMGQICGINKKVTSHVARHTFATLTLTKGVSIESVSKMLGHTKISTTQLYARITDKKISHEMNIFASNVKELDMKLQFLAGQKEVTLEDIMNSLKISTGNISDAIWENLTSKVWNRMHKTDRQIFSTKVNVIENKPNTIKDFFVSLIDYFLGCTANANDNSTSEENEFPCEEMKMIV